MAYAKRADDLANRLTTLSKEGVLTTPEYTALAPGWNSWFELRSALLSDLAALVSNMSKDRTNQQAVWESRIKDTAAGLGTKLADPLSSVSDATEKAKAVAQTAVLEEGTFLAGLAALGVASQRDLLAAYPDKFEVAKSDLEAKWNTVYGDNARLLEEERAVMSELTRMMNSTVEEFARHFRSTKEAAADLSNQIGSKVGPGLAALGLKALIAGGAMATPLLAAATAGAAALIGQIKSAGEKWVSHNDDVGTRVREFKALMKQQSGGIFIGYRHSRQAAQDFVKANEYDSIKNIVSDATSKLDTWINSMPSEASGMRTDAGEFKDAAVSGLKAGLDACEKTYRAFVLANKDRFLGPVGPELSTSITQMTQMDQYSNEIVAKARNIHDLVKNFNDEANGFWIIDIKADWVRWFGGEWEALTKAQRDAIEHEYSGQVSMIKDEMRKRILEVIQQSVLLQAGMTPEQVKSLISVGENVAELKDKMPSISV